MRYPIQSQFRKKLIVPILLSMTLISVTLQGQSADFKAEEPLDAGISGVPILVNFTPQVDSNLLNPATLPNWEDTVPQLKIDATENLPLATLPLSPQVKIVTPNTNQNTAITVKTPAQALSTRINGVLNHILPSSLEVKNPGSNAPQTTADNVLFDGATRQGQGKALPQRNYAPNQKNGSANFIVNDDGVQISGKAAEYYTEVRKLVENYKNKINLSESLGVMDDAYADVWAKLKVIESVIPDHQIDRHNTHLPETLTWVDGIAQDGDKKIAIYTHRVFFHPAPNPQSEIQEGIRRVGGYLKEAEMEFKKGGRAERTLGPLDQVVLGFDTRGYTEIKQFLRSKEAELNRNYGNRFRFVYLDDIAQVPQNTLDMRKHLNTLIAQYKGDSLQKIVEGVVYSRYTGLLLELKTLEYYYNHGYKIKQSGHEIFDADGHYVTELDAVVESPEGITYLVEAKSSRVLLPEDRVLEGKILYKLDSYKKNQALLEKETGAPLNVVFAMDLGIPKTQDNYGQETERSIRQNQLMEFLKTQAPILSQRYGFPVSFLFINGGHQQN